MDLRSQQRYQTQPRYETPAQQPPASAPPQHPTEPVDDSPEPKQPPTVSKAKDVKQYIPYIIIGILLLTLLFMLFRGQGSAISGLENVKKDQYQAVFLANGQVYFGKIKDMSDKQVSMTNIYYLQEQGQAQTEQPEQKDKNNTNQMSLTKLGKEVHGPEDNLYIERSQVLFWENLTPDSQVVKSIKNSEKQQ